VILFKIYCFVTQDVFKTNQNDSNLIYAIVFIGTTRKRVLMMMAKMLRHK